MCTPILLSILLAATTNASPILVGYLQFEPDATANITYVIAANLTGTPFGCNPSFPACDPLGLLNATLTIDYADPFGALGSTTVTLVDPIEPGLPVPPTWNTDLSLTLLSATFTADLELTGFFLEDGTFFQSKGLVTGSGDLTAQNFFFLTTDSAAPTSIPEPRMLMLAGLAVVAWLRRR